MFPKFLDYDCEGPCFFRHRLWCPANKIIPISTYLTCRTQRDAAVRRADELEAAMVHHAQKTHEVDFEDVWPDLQSPEAWRSAQRGQ